VGNDRKKALEKRERLYGYYYLLLNAGGEIRELPVKVNKIKMPNLKCDKKTTEI